MPAIDLNTLLELVGTLNDNVEPGSASERFRKYLLENVQSAEDVRAYIETALKTSGDQYDKALQDLINHLGQLLGFKVTFGRYRGVRGKVGFDGLWTSPTSGWSLVVEVKTTDVYTVKTATLLGYINELVSERRIESRDRALGLYVYGRFDSETNQLENTIIAENRRESLRVVSVPALISLLELKQDYRLEHNTILNLLLPSPVRIDPIVDLIRNVVAQEQEKEAIEYLPTTAPAQVADVPSLQAIPQPKRGRPRNPDRSRTDYTGKKIFAVIIDGTRHEVDTWRACFETLIHEFMKRDKSRFEEIASQLQGRSRPYFTDKPELLRQAGTIRGTNLFFETNLSANQIARIATDLSLAMGLTEGTIVFDTD